MPWWNNKWQAKNNSSSESELDEDAVAAYYAVRIDKSQGMTITAAAAEGRWVILKIGQVYFLQIVKCICPAWSSVFLNRLTLTFQLRGFFKRISQRAQPSESAGVGRASSRQGDSQEGQQQPQPCQGGRHVWGGACSHDDQDIHTAGWSTIMQYTMISRWERYLRSATSQTSWHSGWRQGCFFKGYKDGKVW